MALLISSVAVSRLLQSEGAQPDMVGGLSVGAFGAAVTSGVLPFDAALPVVRLRGELMHGIDPRRSGDEHSAPGPLARRCGSDV